MDLIVLFAGLGASAYINHIRNQITDLKKRVKQLEDKLGIESINQSGTKEVR